MIIGIGVDIVEIERIRDLRARQGERFQEKIFTPAEVEYCLARKQADQHFAARFAAKEAVMKALGTGWAKGVTFKNIEVVRAGDASPRLLLHGPTAEIAAQKGARRFHLSLAHSDDYAVAQVVLEDGAL